jgi:uncharacterized membrane protein YtjA (UPF0391 family)
MFFSEEKNQKTFNSALAPLIRPWPATLKRRRHKSLLLLFFRKEELPCLTSQLKESNVLRWILVLIVLTLVTGLMMVGAVPGFGVGLARILFGVYVSLLAATLLVAVIRG